MAGQSPYGAQFGNLVCGTKFCPFIHLYYAYFALIKCGFTRIAYIDGT